MHGIPVHELIIAAILGAIMGIVGYYATRKFSPVIGRFV